MNWKKIIILVIAIILSVGYPEVMMKIVCAIVMFIFVYKFGEVIFMNKGLFKLTAIEWWLYTYVLYLISYENGVIISKFEAILFLIASIIFGCRVIIMYFESTSLYDEIVIALMLVFACIFISMIAVQLNNRPLFFFFKILTIFIITSGIKASTHTNRAVGMLIILLFYIAMLGANGLLNIRFLNESTAQGWENFYIAIQNIYSLPEISNLTEKNEIIEIICSFVLFRIADAVMLGGLVAIITENDLGWTEERPKKQSS